VQCVAEIASATRAEYCRNCHSARFLTGPLQFGDVPAVRADDAGEMREFVMPRPLTEFVQTLYDTGWIDGNLD
jgi:hypothetical protein